MQKVLLLMDFQRNIVDRLDAGRAVDAARCALAAARESGIPVMFVRVAFREGHPEVHEANPTFAALVAQGDGLHQDDAATQVHDALAPHPDEPVVIKRRVSAFSGSDLDVLLRAARADELVLAGISTSGVVLSTVRQAADLDYRLTVLADACFDRDDEVHRVLVHKVFPRQATVTDVDGWIETLG